MDRPRWSIERIRDDHIRSDFSCGNAVLDEFLARYARQNDERGVGRTYVATERGCLAVQGYYTLRGGEVLASVLPERERKRLPRYPVPVVHLGRLAVDRRVQGRGLGEQLLVDALRRAYAASQEVAAYAVEVLAIDENARRFYLRYGFQEMQDDPMHLYLAMKVVERLVRPR